MPNCLTDRTPILGTPAPALYCPPVNTCTDDCWPKLESLLNRYGLTLVRVGDGEVIPGSYWGEPEAGLVGHSVYARTDTPVHSVLHEACHVICMDVDRRKHLHTDAGGEYAEENAVCYLEIVLAESIGISVPSICADMDGWGYTFRLGSAFVWFTNDAQDAHRWLLGHRLITESGSPVFQLRAA